MLYSSLARNFQGFLLVVHCSIFKIPFRFTFFFQASLSCETAYLLYHIFLSLSSTFFNFFQILFSMWSSSFSALGLFVSLGENVSLGESFYIISHTTALVKTFFCFWLAAQWDSNLCRILATGCTKDLRYQTFVTITLSFILPSLFIFALIYLSVLIYFLCHLLSFIYIVI